MKIARNTDPFKKYWFVILLAFGGIGAWICLPFMDGGIGSGRVSAPEEGSLRGAQSLDSVSNPTGASGGPVDLSMDPSHRKSGSTMTSSLYQAPDEPAKPATTAAAAPAAGTTLADALRDVSKKSASADATGWGGQKAQKGFTPPHAAFGGMSGLGGSSGSGASASAHYGSVTGFGATKTDTGVTFTKGLRGDAGEDNVAGAKGKAMGALQNASNVATAAAKQLSNDSARSMAGTSFDGSGGGSRVGGGGAGSTGSGAYANLDSAPINLKANDYSKLNSSKVEVPTANKTPVVDPNDQMRQTVMMMGMMMLMSGLMGGL